MENYWLLIASGAQAQQLDVSLNLQLCDLLQVRNSVFVVQLMHSVDCHPEVMEVAEDNDLQENINVLWLLPAKLKCVA